MGWNELISFAFPQCAGHVQTVCDEFKFYETGIYTSKSVRGSMISGASYMIVKRKKKSSQLRSIIHMKSFILFSVKLKKTKKTMQVSSGLGVSMHQVME